MMYQLLITILAISLAGAYTPISPLPNIVCAEEGHADYNDSDLQKVIYKLAEDVDREGVSGCLMDRKFIENSGNVWGDVESIEVCATPEDLKVSISSTFYWHLFCMKVLFATFL